MAAEWRNESRRPRRLLVFGGVAVVLLAAGVAAVVLHQDTTERPQRSAQTWECLMAYSGFNPATPVGIVTYLLDQRLTRGGYPERGQEFYEKALADLRDRDPRKPLGADRFGPDCEDLKDGDLNPLASPFDDDRPAEAIVRREDGRFDEATLADVVRQLHLRTDHGRPVYARVEGTDAMVVVATPSGDRAAHVFSDADHDGKYVETDSEGLRVPAYRSKDGTAVAGVAFFSSTPFEFAYTSQPGAVLASLSSDGLHLPLIAVHDGVADLSDAWGIALECGKPFTISWTDDSGAPVDELTDTFYCSPVD
jgi:hypothetical protein